MGHPKQHVIPCKLDPNAKEAIALYAEELKAAAHTVGSHGMTEQEFFDSGLFYAAVERIRGQKAASMKDKYSFLEEILAQLQISGRIKSWSSTGGKERHDFQVILNDGRISVIEAKGCLDGNNTNISIRPPNADEFVIWSLCQNPGSNLKTGVWSAVHTRIGADIIAESKQVDGLIIFDMLCGTKSRPCPKIQYNPNVESILPSGRRVPPPCLYLFPRTIPNARNNPSPPTRELAEVGLMQVMYEAFKCEPSDITHVVIEAQMDGVEVQRKTTLVRDGTTLGHSQWVNLKRAAR